MRDNAPNPALVTKTILGKLGDVDSFISDQGSISLPLIDWILHGITNRIYPDPDPFVSHFQNPTIGFPHFPEKQTALSMPGFYRRASRIPKFASRIRDCHFSRKNTALSTPEFYRRASRTRDCHLSRKKKQP